MNQNKFYVYAWYFVESGKVFHVGKGTGKRCYNKSTHRNQYFKNIIAKYKDLVSVKILENNLSEQEAWDLEVKYITEYKAKGECETNFHKGGCGGYTGNYDSVERNRKLSEAASKRVGEKNPMHGKHHSEETKRVLHDKNLGKHLTEEHKQKLILANTNREKTPKELERIRTLNLGKTMSDETKQKMLESLCEFEFQVVYEDIEHICLGHAALYKYCLNTFKISRTIVDQIIENKWKPKFKKHLHLANLHIIKIKRCIDQAG